MAQPPQSFQDELTRRHRKAAMVVIATLVMTIVLIGVAFVGGQRIYRPGDQTLAMALWIAIMVFGLGAVALRRTQFSAMRLQDIAALRGISGLLATLQGTTIQLASLGGAIALMGFIVTILTGEKPNMLRAGLIAIAVLLYCYPRRTAWQRVVQGIQQAGDADAPPVKGRIA
jgi:hypothetical protein